MPRHSNQVVQQIKGVNVPVVGAKIYVYDQEGVLATLTDDAAGPLDNPVTSDEYGNFYYNTDVGVYRHDYWYGGKLRYTDQAVMVGDGLPLPDSVLLALGAATGAAFVGTADGSTVQAALDSRPARAGLFVAMNGSAVSAGATVLFTSGYRTAERGAALYVHDPLVNSAYVAANPRTAFITLDGRGWRLSPHQKLDVFMFGAYANAASPTPSDLGDDDYPAFQAAALWMRDNMGEVMVPDGYYRLSQRWDITNRVHFYGENNGDDSAGTGSLAWPYYRQGAVLIWDANKAGIRVYSGTTIDDQTVVAAGPFSAVFLYPGGARSRFRNLTLLCRSSWVPPNAVPGAYDFVANATKNLHAFEARTLTFTENFYIDGWWGDGLRLWGSTDGAYAGIPYGNLNSAVARSHRVVRCAGRAFYVAGRDANNVLLEACDAQLCGGAGFYDETLLGSCYDTCDSSTNNLLLVDDTEELSPGSKTPMNGSYMVAPANLSGGSFSTYIGCYTESGRGGKSVLGINCTIIGGNLATENERGTNEKAVAFNGGNISGRHLTYNNNRGSTRVYTHFGYSDTSNTVLAWGSTLEVAADGHRLYLDGTNRVYNLRFANSSSANPLQIPAGGIAGQRTAAKGAGWGVNLPGGFYFGGIGIGTGRKQHHNCGTAAPTTGTWVLGDFIWNEAPAANGILGWLCVTAGTPGTWVAVRAIQQQAAQANSTATDVAGVVADFNALLAKLRTAGILAP